MSKKRDPKDDRDAASSKDGSMLSSQGSEGLAETEARTGLAKPDLELQKLALEIKFLARQLSWQGNTLEWIKAGTVFAALIGVAATLYLGQEQARLAQIASSKQATQIEEGRAADRFDKALSRMADRTDVGARITGVAGLRLFLTDGVDQHQRDAVHYLVTAIAEEKSPEVQQTILASFADAKHFGQEAKDDALRTAIELNRTLTESVFDRISIRLVEAQRALVAKFLAKKPEEVPSLAPGTKVNGLTFLQNMEVQNIRATQLFYDAQGEQVADVATLDRYVLLINLLLKAGAKNVTNNWAGIYCQQCDFTAAGSLGGAIFDDSLLSGANFSHVNLQNSSFRNADLGRTNFFHSDLSNANLSWGGPLGAAAERAIESATRDRPNTTFPYLECATLNGANLDSLPLGMITRFSYRSSQNNDQLISSDLKIPRMTYVKFDANTKLSKLGIRFESRFDGKYYAALMGEELKHFESAFDWPTFDWPEPVGKFEGSFGAMYNAISFDTTGEKPIVHFVRAGRYYSLHQPTSISAWAKPLFLGALNQPFWRAMPATSQILSAAQSGSDSAGQSHLDRNAPPKYTCSQSPVPRSSDLETIVP